MALEITYWTKAFNPNMSGLPITSETRSLSGTSAQSAATPANADAISIVATENARFAYGSNPTAIATAGDNGHYLASGERIWFPAISAYKIAGIQAA